MIDNIENNSNFASSSSLLNPTQEDSKSESNKPDLTKTSETSTVEPNKRFNIKNYSKSTTFYFLLTVILIYIGHLIFIVALGWIFGASLVGTYTPGDPENITISILLLSSFLSLFLSFIFLTLAVWTNIARIKNTSLSQSRKEFLSILPHIIFSHAIVAYYPFYLIIILHILPLLILVIVPLTLIAPFITLVAPFLLIYYNLEKLPKIAFQTLNNDLQKKHTYRKLLILLICLLVLIEIFAYRNAQTIKRQEEQKNLEEKSALIKSEQILNKKNRTKEDLLYLQHALSLYKQKTGKFPTDLDTLDLYMKQNPDPDFKWKFPLDPYINKPYTYNYLSNESYSLCSSFADMEGNVVEYAHSCVDYPQALSPTPTDTP